MARACRRDESEETVVESSADRSRRVARSRRPRPQPALPAGGRPVGGDLSLLTNRFAAGFTVPQLPRGEVSALAATAFCVLLSAGACAHDVGNLVLRFLDQEIEASVLKVRSQKFWVSASVIVGNAMVRVKARIWERRDGEVVLELQRRTGCVAAFSNIYSKLLAFFLHSSNFRILTKEGQSVCPRENVDEEHDPEQSDDECSQAPPPPPLPPALPQAMGGFQMPPPPPPSQAPVAGGPGCGVDACGPGASSLFAMMLCTSVPSLLIDVFRALVGLFGQRPDLLLCDEFVKNVKSLLTDRFPADPGVQLALADLLVQAAGDDRFNEHLAKEGMLPLLADKLCTQAVELPAKKRLGRAIEGAAQSLSTSDLKKKVALVNELASTLEAGCAVDIRVKDRLQEALKWLQDSCAGTALPLLDARLRMESYLSPS